MVKKKYFFLIVALLFSIFFCSLISAGIIVRLVSPENNSISNGLIEFNVTSDYYISNMTIFVWNLSGNIVYNLSSPPWDSYNMTSYQESGYAENLVDSNNYTWNFLSFNNVSEFNWSYDGNHTFQYDGIDPSLILNYPYDNQYLNSKNILINLTVNDSHFNYTYISIINSSSDIVNFTYNYSVGNYIEILSVQFDDIYSMDFQAVDNVNNYNITTIYNITIDTTYPLISFGSGTENNSAIKSRNWIYVNVSVIELNEANLTFYLYNLTSLINSTTFNNSQRIINWTNLSDGIYYYNVTIIDLANNKNSTDSYAITLDTTSPLISFGSGTENNSANKSRNWIYVNVSVTELNEANITFNLYNNTNGITLINSTTFNNSRRTINWTNLSDGIYYYNVTLVDLANNKNSTDRYSITLDTSSPVFTNLANLTVITNHSLRYDFDATDLTTITFSINDTSVFNITTDGIISNITALNVARIYYLTINATDILNHINSSIFFINVSNDTFPPAISLISPADGNSYVSGTSITYSYRVYDNSSTRCYLVISDANKNYASSVNITGGTNSFTNTTSSTGDHDWYISCTDIYGNHADSGFWTFTITSNGSGDDDGDDSGGGIAGNYSFWTSTYAPTYNLFINGYTKALSARERVKVAIGTENHYVGVISLTASSATINVSSNPIQAVFNIGDEKKFDATGDGVYYDISIRLNGINNNKANITIKTINEKVPSSANTNSSSSNNLSISSNRSSLSTNLSANNNETTGGDSLSWIKKNFFWIIIFIIVFFILLTVFLIIFIFRSETKSNGVSEKLDKFVKEAKTEKNTRPEKNLKIENKNKFNNSLDLNKDKKGFISKFFSRNKKDSEISKDKKLLPSKK